MKSLRHGVHNNTVQIDKDIVDVGFSLARNTFNNLKEYHFDIEFNLSLKDKIINDILKDESDADVSSAKYYFHSIKSRQIENFYTSYLIQSTNVICTFKTVQINKKTVTDNILEEELNTDEVTNSNDVYKLYDLSFYVNENEDNTFNLENHLEILNSELYISEKTPVFHTIGVSQYGYELKSNKLGNLSIYDNEHIAIHYGLDFLEEFNSIKDNLKNKSHGLILLHGEPGTGKTSMIRQLIAEVCEDKKVIYVPSYMIENIASPEFISFLSEHENSILILEDAEMVLKQRDDEFGTQAVSNILNITNGLLNDSTNIQVLATFNMSRAKLDKALLRAGRLINEWEFKKLSIERAKKLAEFANIEIDITEPMSVSDIYNYEDYLKNKQKEKPTRKKIGL